jgi:ABC-type polysaccharide/polyol phosphate transport system ATPase subunit
MTERAADAEHRGETEMIDEKRARRLRREHQRRERKARRESRESGVEESTSGWEREITGTASEQPALVTRNIRVVYEIYGERAFGKFRRPVRDVVALDDVSLTVNKGEALGVIGSNGAGKTTLIRVMAGTLPPNEGRVDTFGLEAQMLGLGAGFNRTLTGRRNIYLGGLAAGMTKNEIDDAFDEIVGFAELGLAIDRPVETYSSGMSSRLAFAVAIQNEPDILLIDEALAVGDESFKQKSKARMERMLENTGTIVMVSHGVGRLRKFCDRILWMDQGRIMAIGDPSEVVAKYRAFLGVEDADDDDDD